MCSLAGGRMQENKLIVPSMSPKVVWSETRQVDAISYVVVSHDWMSSGIQDGGRICQ